MKFICTLSYTDGLYPLRGSHVYVYDHVRVYVSRRRFMLKHILMA